MNRSSSLTFGPITAFGGKNKNNWSDKKKENEK